MDINLQGFVFALIFSVVSAVAFGQDETTCGCHIKDDKTSCSINVMTRPMNKAGVIA